MNQAKQILEKMTGKFCFVKETEGGWLRYWDEKGRKGVKAMMHPESEIVEISTKMLGGEISKEDFLKLLK